MATIGSLKISWLFADFSTRTTTLEPLYYNAENGVDTNFYKTRVQTIKNSLETSETGFGEGFISSNGTKCTGINAASFTLGTTTNIYNADTYEP